MKEKDATKQAKIITLDKAVIIKLSHNAIDAGKSVKKYIEDILTEIANRTK